MNYLYPRPGVIPRRSSLVAICLIVIALATPLTAKSFPVLFDGQFYYTGGNVTIDVLHYGSVYDEVLQLRTSLGTLDLLNGSHIGSQMVLTTKQLADLGIGIGDELDFGLHVRNTGNNFYLGSGDRNADGLSHAYIRPGSANKYYVGFEDLMGGGDRDYNDTVVRFSGGVTTSRAENVAREAQVSQVAEPALLLLLLPAMGLWSLKRRTK